jgi:hypothetical protein
MPSIIPSSTPLGRTWLPLLLSAFLLGGCHARSRGCHASSGGSDTADGIVAAFYVFYILGWIIISATEG